MIIDAANLFDDAHAVAAGSENGVYSTYSVNLKATANNIGVGENLYVVVILDAATTGAGDTLNVYLVTDDNAGLNSPTVVQKLGTFAANSAIGSKLIARISPATLEQYIGLKYYAEGSGAIDTGTVTAMIVHDVDAVTYYADNITIS